MKINKFWANLLDGNERTRKTKFLFLIILSSLTLYPRLNMSTIGYDDAVYAQKAKEMIIARDYFYVNPTYNWKIDFDNKPPIFFWFSGAMGKLFGFTNFSMRFIPATFGILCIGLVFLTVSRFYNVLVGFLASIVLLYTQQFLYYSRAATMESIFAVFLYLGLFSFWWGFSQKKYNYFYFMGIFFGLAVMTRQISGLFGYFIILIFLFILRDFSVFKTKQFYLGILISLIIFLPWHVYMIVKFKSLFINNYLGTIFKYGLKREAIWYEYIRKIFENYWPWLPFLLMGLFREIKSLILKKYSETDTKKIIFILTITFTIYTIFQISSFKGPQYMYPLYVTFAIIVAKTIHEMDKKLVFTRIFIFFGITITAVALIFPIFPHALDSHEFKDTIHLVPEIKKIDGEINTIYNSNYWHFRFGLLYYADKMVTSNSFEQIIAKMIQDKENYFVLKKQDFAEIIKTNQVRYKIKVINSTKDSFLFTNKLNAQNIQ